MKTFAVSFLCSPSKARKNGESPIEVSISVNGERVCMQLPKKCEARVFRKSLTSKSPNDIKIYCETIRNKINEYQTYLTMQGKAVTARKIRQYLEGKGANESPELGKLILDFLSQKTDHPDAYNKYKITFNRMTDYFGADRCIDEITPQDVLNYKAKYEKKFAQGTLKNEMKRFKSLFLYAFNSGYIKRSPFSGLRFTFKEEDKPYLTYEEIEAIRDAKLPENLDRVRNFFLFMCFSGLEYADMIELKKDDVKINRYGQYYIKKKRVKTGVEYISILYEDAEEMWKLFDGEIPIISNQKSNAALKIVAERSRVGKTITTLTARHTYATYLLAHRHIPVDILQKMLGHTSSRQSLHYGKILEDSVFLANKDRAYTKSAPALETRQDAEDLAYFKQVLGIE